LGLFAVNLTYHALLTDMLAVIWQKVAIWESDRIYPIKAATIV